MKRVLLYLVLGVAGLALTFVALVYLSIQVAKLLAFAVLVLAAVVIGKRLLTRDTDDDQRLPHRERPPLDRAGSERHRIRHG